MRFIAYEPAHVALIEHAHADVLGVSYITREYTEAIARLGPAYTAEHLGKILGCAGLADSSFGIATLWAFGSAALARHLIVVHRAVERFLEATAQARRFRRIEATTPVVHEAGCRWLELLKFKYEGTAERYTPDGMDHYRYARLFG